MERPDVFRLINREREYQEKRLEQIIAEKPHRDEDHHIADWLCYMEEHIRKAQTHVYFLNNNLAMAEIRKVAALAVAAMEYIDTPSRITAENDEC